MPCHLHYNTETQEWEVVDEQHNVVAVGQLQIDLIPGATRHGTVSFVANEAAPKPGGPFGGIQ